MALSLQYAESKDETKRRLPLRGVTALGRYGAWPSRRCRHPSDNGHTFVRSWAPSIVRSAAAMGNNGNTRCVAPRALRRDVVRLAKFNEEAR